MSEARIAAIFRVSLMARPPAVHSIAQNPVGGRVYLIEPIEPREGSRRAMTKDGFGQFDPLVTGAGKADICAFRPAVFDVTQSLWFAGAAGSFLSAHCTHTG